MSAVYVKIRPNRHDQFEQAIETQTSQIHSNRPERFKQRRHARDDREVFAKFSRSFREFSQVFRSFRRFGHVFGPVRTCLDVFGCHRTHSEAFGRSRLCHIPAKPRAPKISEMCALKPFSCCCCCSSQKNHHRLRR